MLYIKQNTLFTENHRFDPVSKTWVSCDNPDHLNSISETEAVQWLQKKSGTPFKAPIAVIGPRAASEEQRGTAHELGRRLAILGLTVICGGREGVMESVCQGVAQEGGLCVGILPDDDWNNANEYVGIPIATGIGVARNAIIARSSAFAIAIGGGLGTLSEVALTLQFKKPVFGLCNAPQVEGVQQLKDINELEREICMTVLKPPVC